MKKSQATNTFNKGMIMDLNPIVTPNDVLTNCLNGTLVTFNGNENVLQNDMGNGRVETAYLPEGYVPLGTAELGGIIYIVSYNPLNNKCQIGSFPSPERNISSEELSENVVTIQNNQFKEGNKVINTIVKVKLLTGEYTKLCPGDKFAIYSTNKGITNNSDYISDVNTGIFKVDNDPRYVTIHVVSIGDDGKITYLDDYLKWDSNQQYYIKECDGLDQLSTDIDSYRSLTSSAYNVFNSKVSGELALLFELKTIDSLSVTWDAEVKDTQDGKKAVITFNTNWTSTSPKINVDKLVLSESTLSKNLSSTVTEGDVCSIISSDRKNDGTDAPIEVEVGSFTYDASKSLQEYIWNYQITPAMEFGELDYLTTKGTINFSEIGSGKISLDEWRYYIQENGFYLNWGLSAYPEKNKTIKQVTFTFIAPNQVNNNLKYQENQVYTTEDGFPQYIVKNKTSFSGNFQDILNFDNDSRIVGGNISKNSLYLVDICIKYGNDTSDKYIHTYRWMYTTGQWNEQYVKESIRDFDSLTLSDVFKLTASLDVKDNIKEQVFTNYPNLIPNEDPGDGGKFSSMGIKTISVNYDKTSASFSNSGNIQANITIHPDKYKNLFSFNDEYTQYTNTISSKHITHSTINIQSDKTSGTSDVVESSFMGEESSLPDDFVQTVETALTQQIKESTNSKLIDSFDASIINGSSSSQMNICLKGALFSRINADLVSKTLSVGQRVRPILYNEDDYDSLGFDTSGYLKYLFLEGHRDGGGGQPFYFKFGYKYLQGDEIKSYESNKDYWNPSDEFTRETYWDNTPPYTDYLNPWMQNAQGPFQLLQYTYYHENYVNFEGNTNTRLNKKYNLWVRTNQGHFMPINAFWDSASNSVTTISDQLKAILMQIYYVDTDTTAVTRYSVDNINNLDPYTEGWEIVINSHLNISDMNSSIYLSTSKGSISLTELQQNIPESIVNLSNVTYGSDYQLNITSPSFKHTFKVNTRDLYAIYENNKVTTIPALYDISTKIYPEIGQALNANNLYVYKQGEGFLRLNKQNSSIIIPDGVITSSEDKLILYPSGQGKSNLDICNMFIFKNNQLSLDEDRLLSYIVSFFYGTQEGARYKGNSKYPFLIGTSYK